MQYVFWTSPLCELLAQVLVEYLLLQILLSVTTPLEKVFLKVSQNSKENTCVKVSFLIKLQAGATASDLSLVSSWRFIVYFILTEKWNEKREIPCWSSNIYFYARASICLMSKISKEIWQMVIWSENVFKGNLMPQFSWLEEFR